MKILLPKTKKPINFFEKYDPSEHGAFENLCVFAITFDMLNEHTHKDLERIITKKFPDLEKFLNEFDFGDFPYEIQLRVELMSLYDNEIFTTIRQSIESLTLSMFFRLVEKINKDLDIELSLEAAHEQIDELWAFVEELKKSSNPLES